MAKVDSTKRCIKCKRLKARKQFLNGEGPRRNWCQRCRLKDAERRRWLASEERIKIVCNECGKILPATQDHFYAHPQGKHGFLNKCISCVLAYRKKHVSQWGRRWREKVLLHYSGGDYIHCVCCGETQYEFMTLDHIDRDGGQRRKQGGYNGSGWYLKLIREGFTERLRTLCYNCNCSQAYSGYCPHEREREAAKK